MARKSSGPWWWAARGQWFVTVRGKQIPLGTDEAEARHQWHILEAQAQSHKAGDDNPFSVIAEEFLDWIHRNKKPKTYKTYRIHLEAFSKVHGTVKVRDLKPLHVDAVLKEHPEWGKSTVRGFMVCISTALNWAVKQGLTTRNPLHRRLDIPAQPSRGREANLPQEDYEILMAHANPALRDFLIACRNTGTRPHIVATVQAKDFDEQAACWVLEEHKTDHDGMPMVVHLTPTLVAMTKRLIQKYPTGPLFRNNRGNAWRDEVWGKAMAGLRGQLKRKVARLEDEAGKLESAGRTEEAEARRREATSCTLKSRGIMYGFRHGFATEQLSAGVPDAHVAAMMGHKSTTMLHKHYSHLLSNHKVLKGHLDNIKPVKGEGDETPE